MISKTSYLIKDLDWTQAEREMKKKVAAHPMASRGLGLICSAPKCQTTDPLLLFIHPDSKYEMHLCKLHWCMANYEMKELQRKHDTLGAFLSEVARDNGGDLKFASIGTTTGLFGGK